MSAMEDAVRDYAEGELASCRLVREGVGIVLAELDRLRAERDEARAELEETRLAHGCTAEHCVHRGATL